VSGPLAAKPTARDMPPESQTWPVCGGRAGQWCGCVVVLQVGAGLPLWVLSEVFLPSKFTFKDPR